jgi:hypothetical protein
MALAPSLAVQFSAPSTLVVELLAWVSARPRGYGETMEAWRTSCPRMPVWEDALENALVAVVADDGGPGRLTVRLTPKGRALLDERLPG